jgi:DNA-binding Lrp family transcriptional regulator
MARNSNDIRRSDGETALDRVDCQLLRELQANARMSNKELAEKVGLAPSTCLERLRRLRERGILKGFHADVDLNALGRRTQAMIAVRLGAHSRAQIDAFHEHVLALPESLAVLHVSGGDDYLLHVAVRDTEDLRRFVLDLTSRQEVAHVETHLVFDYRRKAVIEPMGNGE